MHPGQILEVPSTVMARAVGEELVILDLRSSTYFGLNEVGARAWELFSEGWSLAKVCNALATEFEATREQIEADIQRLVRELSAAGLAQPIDPGPATPTTE